MILRNGRASVGDIAQRVGEFRPTGGTTRFGKVSDRSRKWIAEGIALGYPETGPWVSVWASLAWPVSLVRWSNYNSIMGSCTKNWLPGQISSSYPGLSAQIRPPWAVTIPLAIASPNPGPPPLNFVVPDECSATSPVR